MARPKTKSQTNKIVSKSKPGLSAWERKQQEGAPRKRNTSNGYDDREWFEVDSVPESQDELDELASSAYDDATYIQDHLLSNLRSSQEEYIRRYEQDPAGFGKTWILTNPDSAENLVSSIIDLYEAEVTYIKPKAYFMSTDGEWSDQIKAQKMERAVDYIFEQNKVYELAPRVWTDALKTGYGTVKVVADSAGNPILERVHYNELVVNPMESYYSMPQTIYQIKPVAKRKLAQMLKAADPDLSSEDIKDIIDECSDVPNHNRYFTFLSGQQLNLNDMTLVVEGWHLPDDSGEGGYHVIACKGKCIHFEKWERKRFPFAFIQYAKRSFGEIYGKPIVEELFQKQDMYTYTNLKIEDMLESCATPFWVAPAGGKINIEHLTENTPGRVVTCEQGEPRLVTFNPVPSQILNFKQQLVDDAYEQVGFTKDRATAQVPARVETGEAIREFNDFGAKRQNPKLRAYEQFFMDMAQIVVDEKNHQAKLGKTSDVYMRKGKGQSAVLKRVSWKEISLDDTKCKITHMPGSLLPSTPIGRTKIVNAWLQAGLINRQQSMSLMDMPDIDRFMSYELSPYNLTLEHIQAMIEDGEFIVPTPMQDLQLSHDLTMQAYCYYQQAGVPDETLDLLEQYTAFCQFMIQQAQSASQQASQPSPEQQAQQGVPAAPQVAAPAQGVPTQGATA